MNIISSNGWLGLKSAGGDTAILFNNDATTVMAIRYPGNVGIGTTNPADVLHVYSGEARVNACVKKADGTAIAGTCPSDIQLKEVVSPLSLSLEKLIGLEPVFYKWRSQQYPQFFFGSDVNLGLVAQQVEQFIPDLVQTGPDGFKSIKFQEFPFYLLAGIKAQQKEIEELKLQLNSLGLLGEEITPSSTFIEKIKQILADLGLLVENGIARVQELFAQKVVAKQFCLEGDDGETICVDKDQLKQLLLQSSAGYTSSTGGSSVSTLEPEPVPQGEITEQPSGNAEEIIEGTQETGLSVETEVTEGQAAEPEMEPDTETESNPESPPETLPETGPETGPENVTNN